MESDEKESLQLKKLTLEIAEMERIWWKRPNYILAALPTLLALVALSVGFLNGFFSAQLTKLENQKHDLDIQVKDFERRRDDLNRQNDALAKERDVLQKEKNDLEMSVQMTMSAKQEAEEQRRRAEKAEAKLARIKRQIK